MKNYFIRIMTVLAAAAMLSCVPEPDVPKDEEPDLATLTVTPETLSLGNQAGNTAAATIESDSDVLTAELEYSAKTWMEAKLTGNTLTVKALVDYTDPTQTRSARVTITAGQGLRSNEFDVVVTQVKGNEIPKVEVAFNPENLTLLNPANSAADIEVVTPATVFTASVDEANAAWCDISLDVPGKKITATALSQNPKYTPRTATVTVVAGTGFEQNTKTFTVTQAALEAGDPALSFEDEAAHIYSYLANATGEVEVNTNAIELTFSFSDNGEDWCEAAFDANSGKVIFKSKNVNSTAANRSATVTVKAFADSPEEKTATLEVVHHNAVGSPYGTDGVIFWVNPEDPTQVKVVSAKRSAKMNWSLNTPVNSQGDAALNTIAIEDAKDNDNGKANVEGIKTFAASNGLQLSDFPAVNYCETYEGTGWYLPSRRELISVLCAYNGVSSYGDVSQNYPHPDASPTIPEDQRAARAYFESALASIGGDVLTDAPAAANSAGDSSFSSTQHSTANQAFYVRFGKSIEAGAAKYAASPARYARCIKEATLTY